MNGNDLDKIVVQIIFHTVALKLAMLNALVQRELNLIYLLLGLAAFAEEPIKEPPQEGAEVKTVVEKVPKEQTSQQHC